MSMSIASVLKKGKKAAMPKNLLPMLTTLVDEPLDEPGWSYEIKWDGYRSIAYLDKKKVEIRSRNNKSFSEKYYSVHQALIKLNLQVVFDGELVVLDEKGMPDFNGLQLWRSEADGHLVYYVFDVLWLNGYSLMNVELKERRSILKDIIPKNHPIILISENFEATGKEFFQLAEKLELEGIIAKKSDSLYSPGIRSREWLKIKTAKRQEMVIGGYTLNEGSNKYFSSLLVGVYEGKDLIYTGKVGTGFNQKMQADMLKQFKPLVTKTAPFREVPDVNKPSRFRPNPAKADVVWLKPELVCEVSYRELSSEGIMRHPSFQGMRTDKKAKGVVQEKEMPVEKLKTSKLKGKEVLPSPVKTSRKTLLNPKEEMQVRMINGHELKFKNLSKLYWPKEKISKRDMLNYYYQVAPYMLPYLKDRPQSLNRHPNGINGMSFYQKDVTDKVPDWIAKFPYRSEDEDRDKNFMVCTNEAGILYMASLGCIEMNPWSSRIQKPDHPDWCIIDLDPDKNPFDKVIEAALVTRKVLDEVKLPSYVKTSGSTGIHIYIPLGAKYNYEDSKEFARRIVKIVQRRTSSFTSIERATKNRKGKLYLDFLQNRPQATLAAPYSLRPKPGATVSMPLHWEEVKKGLKMSDFNIHNAMKRIEKTGDIFKPVLGKGINLPKANKLLDEILNDL
jgi:bifunctional non-homologous end joining protein LigD